MGHMKDLSGMCLIVVGKFWDLHLTPFSSYPIHLLFFEDVKDKKGQKRKKTKIPLDKIFILGVYDYSVVGMFS